MDFLFVGNHPALDFLNTRPAIDEVPQELLPDFASLAEWFRAAGLMNRALETPSAEARRTLAAALDLRETLRREVIRWEAGHAPGRDFVHRINQLMEEHPVPGCLERTGKGFRLLPQMAARTAGEMLGVLAWHVAHLVATADRERIRQCGSCVLHFLDTSKKGTRRWCSMQLCGNRNKVAAYAERQRNLNC